MSRVHNQDELTMMVTATVIVATGNGVFNSKHLLVQCSGKQLRKARDNVHEHMNNSARMEWKIKTVGQNGGKALIEGMKIRRFLFICTLSVDDHFTKLGVAGRTAIKWTSRCKLRISLLIGNLLGHSVSDGDHKS